MIHLNLDTEQAMLVVIAAEASNALLRARLHRVDPDGVISNSAILQDSKISQIKAQMEAGPMARWPHLSDEDRKAFLHLIRQTAGFTGDHAFEVGYDAITNYILTHRAHASPIGDRQYLPKP